MLIYQNGLELRVDKYIVLYLAPQDLVEALNGRGVRVTLAGDSFAVCDNVKTLGVVQDRDHTFLAHVTHYSACHW
ncbi:hypothetical protein J6590_027028 [Homalodisca vitripennis]|nr:hypothetical protein J6590_027028 [Homalodisca vitripennis]